MFIGCGQEENEEDVFTENATVYYRWVDIWWADVRFTYILEINNTHYCTDSLKLSHESEKNPIKVKLKYKITDEEARCTSQVLNGAKNLKIIEILSIEKLLNVRIMRKIILLFALTVSIFNLKAQTRTIFP